LLCQGRKEEIAIEEPVDLVSFLIDLEFDFYIVWNLARIVTYKVWRSLLRPNTHTLKRTNIFQNEIPSVHNFYGCPCKKLWNEWGDAVSSHRNQITWSTISYRRTSAFRWTYKWTPHSQTSLCTQVPIKMYSSRSPLRCHRKVAKT